MHHIPVASDDDDKTHRIAVLLLDAAMEFREQQGEILDLVDAVRETQGDVGKGMVRELEGEEDRLYRCRFLTSHSPLYKILIGNLFSRLCTCIPFSGIINSFLWPFLLFLAFPCRRQIAYIYSSIPIAFSSLESATLISKTHNTPIEKYPLAIPALEAYKSSLPPQIYPSPEDFQRLYISATSFQTHQMLRRFPPPQVIPFGVEKIIDALEREPWSDNENGKVKGGISRADYLNVRLPIPFVFLLPFCLAYKYPGTLSTDLPGEGDLPSAQARKMT